MKKHISISIFIISLILILSCKQEEDPIISGGSGAASQDSINVFFENDTIKFSLVGCPNDHELASSLVSLATRQDSFGISRKTIIRTEDTVVCNANKLQIGFDITDKIENYPVTREIMTRHLDEIQSKTSTSSRLQIKFSDGCYTYQNFERIFNDSIQLYAFSNNDRFDYEIDKYRFIDGVDCDYNGWYFLVELTGSFKGYLYSTPNVVNKDSIFVECPSFKVSVLHNLNN
ncbi:MAG: hypothetical protein AAFZ15_28865 [Bacteroidota bacterium]